jgi:L-threonate 2-dehydrogenase
MPGPTVAVIAQGAMGAGVARRLTDHGVTVLTSLAGRSARSAERAAAAGMRAVEDAAIAAEAAVILSICPPAEARALAERLAPHLKAAPRKPLYADCNAVSPETVQGIAGVIAATGCPFADAGIIGGPPRRDGYNPKFYASGPGAEALSGLATYGLDVRVIPGGPVGAASALKMSYAGITKGLVALASAMMLASSRAGAAEGLFRELEQSQPQLLAWFRRMVPTSFDKAYRWNGEMEEIADFVGEGRAEAAIYRAIAGFYTQMAAEVAGPGGDPAAITAFLGTSPAKAA